MEELREALGKKEQEVTGLCLMLERKAVEIRELREEVEELNETVHRQQKIIKELEESLTK